MRSAPKADAILAGLPAAVLVIDRKGRIATVNPSAEALMGTSLSRIAKQPVEELVSFADVDLGKILAEPDVSFSARRTPVSVRGRYLGECDFAFQPLPQDERWRVMTITLLPTAAPIETQNRANRPGGASDILAHEIKNPLAAIKGASQLLSRAVGPEQRELTDLIENEVTRIAALIDRMQSLSSHEPSAVEPANIHRLIDRARQTFEIGPGTHAKFDVNYDPSLPPVLVDPQAMLQILTNLFSNAVDAVANIPEKQISVSTRYSFGATYSATVTNRRVRLPIEICISDNGPGVPAELEDQIFSPFVSTKPGSQGLGLALVNKLVRDMNGRIRYNREGAAGKTQFTIYLPMAADDRAST